MSMIHEITALAPRNKRSQRKGRGESSGRGKTSGKGTKGSKARVGKYIKRGYEGGQTPLFRRWPKRGFSNANFERRYYVVNLSSMERFPDGSTVDAAALIEAGLVPDDNLPVKILAAGEFNKKLTVVAGWYSRTAHQKIVAAGGSALNVKNEAFEFPKPKKKFIPRDPIKKKVAEAAAEAPSTGSTPQAGPGQAPETPAATETPAAGPEKPTE
jgi:large subunit ribosomal protein L15